MLVFGDGLGDTSAGVAVQVRAGSRLIKASVVNVINFIMLISLEDVTNKDIGPLFVQVGLGPPFQEPRGCCCFCMSLLAISGIGPP